VTPEELAELHPRLYHVTAPEAYPGILRQGLRSTSALLDLFEIVGERRAVLESQRRVSEIAIEHHLHGRAILSDNSPLGLEALRRCLDDGLGPTDWLKMLNQRVFFWADESGLERLLNARINRHRARLILVLDTLSLAHQYANCMEIAPINTGATIRKAARRGLSTFAAIQAYPYETWRELRGRRDRVLEVTVRGWVCDVEDHLIDVDFVQGPSPARPDRARAPAP
jgi:hypothetical protein